MKTERWPTPRRLQAALVSIWVAALLFLLAGVNGVRVHRASVQTIGKDAVPSILAAEKLKVSLADLDGNVVNALINPPGQEASAIKGYVPRRQEITDSLITAAENITYGDLERTPIRNLTNALSAYERLAIKSQTLHLRGDERGATSTYRDALTQLHDNLLPSADALAKANSDALNRQTDVQLAATTAAGALVVVSGLLLLLALVATQVFLSRRMRRMINIPLLLATGIVVVLLTTTMTAFSTAREQVRAAHDDAFVSLSALWQARATAYEANSDESRWLFDRDHRPALEQQFFAKSALLVHPPAGQSPDAVTAATTSGPLPSGTTGYLADERKNITFPGEGEAAERATHAFGVYYANDGRVRALENAGQHAQAVRFCNSMAPGDSNWSFVQFDKALDDTININQTAFDASIASGFGTLNHRELTFTLTALALCALGFAGLRPRLREYDV